MGNFNEQVATGAAVVALLFLGLAAYNSASAGSRPAVQPQVRVNQVGYTPDSPKVAFAMLTKPAASVAFTVSSRSGPVYRGRSRTNVGPWNSRYPAVFKLDFTSLARTGQYHIAIRTAGATVVSPPFRIASARSLYHPLVRNAVQWFTSERDGPDVVRSVMHRRPANLTDEHAYVYATPKFLTSGRYSDDLVPPLRRIGGPVDVAGSWFDAGGGYERFAYTASYADALMMIADRDAPGVYPTLASEARFGLSSLEKMWDPVHKVLYIQVGIGNGSRPTKKYPAGLVQGDYNFWFLPQAEDRMNVTPSGHLPYGPTAYYVKYRPVFEAAPPGQRIDPDFAGRFAADFALGAQLDAAHQHVAAQRLLALARGVYAMAKTSNVGQIITTYPHDYYPGYEWKSDMAWGAAEITLADEALHAPAMQVGADLRTAGHWALAYIAQGHPPVRIVGGQPQGGDTFNLYDNGAVAEGELLQAMRQTHEPSPVSAGALLDDLAAQLRVGEEWANVVKGEDWVHGDPFQLGSQLGMSDASPHAFGLYTTNALYRRYGGSAAFQSFAQQQLDFALGDNAWGSSFVVGAGTTFPHCMQSEIANVAGSLNGHGLIQLGATTDGPSGTFILHGLPSQAGQRACDADPGYFKSFDTAASAYQDDVVDWPTVEPADDYTSAPLLAFALAAQGPAGRSAGP